MPILVIRDDGFDVAIMQDIFLPNGLVLMLIDDDGEQVSPLVHIPMAAIREFLEVLNATSKK